LMKGGPFFFKKKKKCCGSTCASNGFGQMLTTKIILNEESLRYFLMP